MQNAIELIRRYNRKTEWKTVFTLCALILIIRLVCIGIMGPMPQDAYYDFYAQHLDLSYYDHPPMIAYLLRIFTTFFGKKVFALKLADTCVTLITILIFFRFAKKFLSERVALIATILLFSTFMASILSLISTPDVPLMLFWTLSISFLYEAIFKKHTIYWVWAGICTGLSFDSKYTALFILLGLLGFLIFSKTHRKILYSPWIFVYLFCFIVVSLPVIVWNVQNNFASFRFQSAGRMKEGTHIDPLGFFGVVGHQSAILLPILLFFFFLFLYRLIRKYKIRFSRIPVDQLFLLCFFIPLFIGFFLLSFIYWVKLNWMMPAYITGIVWIARFWTMKWLRYQLMFSILIHVVLAVEVIFYVFPIRSDDTWFGWKSLSNEVSDLRKHYPDSFIFSSDDYKTSSELNFFLNEMVYSANIIGQRALQYDFIGSDLKLLNGKNAIYIDSNPRFVDLKNEDGTLPVFFYSYFEKIISLKPILIYHNGQVARKFSVFYCLNYNYAGNRKMPDSPSPESSKFRNK